MATTLMAGTGSLVATGTAVAVNDVAPSVVHALQEWVGGTGQVRLSSTARVVVAADASPRLRQLAGQVVDELAELTGLRLGTAVGEPKPGDVASRVDATASYGGVSADLRSEAYRLETTDRITITGGTETGAYYGTVLVYAGERLPDLLVEVGQAGYQVLKPRRGFIGVQDLHVRVGDPVHRGAESRRLAQLGTCRFVDHPAR